jgi:hypothetical protein
MTSRTIEALQALAERGATEGERQAAANALADRGAPISPAVDIAALARKVYYFGAWAAPGHYLFSPGGYSGGRSVGPWRLEEIDGMLTPHRGGSNSVFFAPGIHDRATMLAVARVAFPQVVARILAYDDSVNGGHSR